MKSIAHLGEQPVSIPLVADDVLELHAGRLLLLLLVCGVKNEVVGLTKLAKLDFFVRYPRFFERLAAHIEKPVELTATAPESPMVRHHYGPWDRRYYHVLPYLDLVAFLT